MAEAGHSEVLRKLVHVCMVGFALFLRWIPWWLAALLAIVAMILCATWIPRRWGDRLMRPGDREGLLHSGIFLYALSVLILVVLFRDHLEIAACAWAVLAFGDGAATLLGASVDGTSLPWNPQKTWVGSAGFLFFGALGGGCLLIWVAQRPGAGSLQQTHAFLLATCAAFLGALTESLPLELNDNLSVPLLAGGFLFTLQGVDPTLWTASAPGLLRNLFIGLAVNIPLAWVAWLLGTVTWSGVAGGMAIGITIATFAGARGFLVLAAFFTLGSAATRIGYARKARQGIAQERGGARGIVHAVANGGIAAYLAFLSGSVAAPKREALLIAFVAALATAACDTLGSEVGPLGRRDPFLLTRLRRVPAGTPGAVSLLGTTAGAAGALLVGAFAAVLGLVPPAAVPIILLAALVGALLESLLGATLEPEGLIGSETINFVNTLAGALTALGLLRLFRGLA
ncbi:MAG TPA: DUF92 domain-containing protein [Candidatus Polarisedimenticolia bacterium]|nr:DUF92 domain-containing protein [Candidatus Polarisedimenticolia bacterium]